MIIWSIRPGTGPGPFVASAFDRRRALRIPYTTRREAVAMVPALVRALAQANR